MDDVAQAEGRQRAVVELRGEDQAERILETGLAEDHRVEEAGQQRLVRRGVGALLLDGVPDLVVGDDAGGIHEFSSVLA